MQANVNAESESSTHIGYALFIFMLVNTTSIVDRVIFTILLEPMKEEFHLSDASMALLQGIPFAIFYAGFGIPIAILSDRNNRRNIISIALMLFTGMAMLCGMAATFVQLFLARIGVAVGESACAPAAHSMIMDLSPPAKRATSLGVYNIGTSLGLLLGLFVGGWVNEYWGWRMALLVAAVPGIIVATLVRFTIAEPRRRSEDNDNIDKTFRFPEVINWVLGQRSFVHLAMGIILLAIATYVTTTWIPAFLSRSYQMKSGEVGTALSIIFGIFGAVATYAYASACDRLARRDIRWRMWILAIGCLLVVPFVVALYLSRDKYVALSLLLICNFLLLSGWLAPAYAVIFSLVKIRMRATASAIMVALMTMGGLGIGVQVVGILSDLYAPSAGIESLRYALLTTTIVVIPWAGIHFFLGARSLRADVQKASHAL